MSDEHSYVSNLRRLLRRWDPRGVLVSDARAADAVHKLREPAGESEAALADARWVCDAAVHPVLEQAIPSAFRVSAFVPVTGLLSLGMISTKAPLATVVYHWLYQSHSAATRYCNYADTTRPLDTRRMLGAYAASTGAACAISLASISLAGRSPRLQAVGLVVPHAAVACAGAISTMMNAQADLSEGVRVIDAYGADRGVSRAAASMTVESAMLLHSILVPSCALLMPTLAMRSLVVPRLLNRAPALLQPIATALVFGGVCVLTPAAAACVPPTVSLSPVRLEERFQGLRGDNGRPLPLYSSRELY